jgi:hypothetical protein
MGQRTHAIEQCSLLVQYDPGVEHGKSCPSSVMNKALTSGRCVLSTFSYNARDVN